MNISSMQTLQTLSPLAQGRVGSTPSPPPPSGNAQGDSVELSEAALQRYARRSELQAGTTSTGETGLPDALASAVADLKGDQANMASDFRTIGDWFVTHGGREALDAFMGATFSEAERRAFPPPVDGLRQDPVAPASTGEVPSSVTEAVSDLKGQQLHLAEDLKALGDYFRSKGGREAHRAFMGANFTDAEREAIRSFRSGSSEASAGTEPPTGS